jgi:hypothetical protein
MVLTSHQALPADFPACGVLDLKGRAVVENVS